jgi:DNA-binding MarR family transcriptional regulator
MPAENCRAFFMLKRPGENGNHRSTRQAAPSTAPAMPGAGVDLGELSTTLGYVLRRAQIAAFKNFKETCKGIDITPAQYSVLIVIERNPGLKQNQISDALGIKRANFVLLLNSLETRGLAERAPAADRRSYALQITPKGRRLLKKMRKLSVDLDDKFSAAIGPQGRETLLRLLRTLLEANSGK